MHAYLWIAISWVVVAVACYFWLGTTSNNSESRGQPLSGITGPSGEWFNQVLRWMWQSRTVSHTFFDILVRALNESKRRVNTTKLGLNVVDVEFEAPPPAHLVILRRVKRQATGQDSSTPDGGENEPPYLENIRANTIGSNNSSGGGSSTTNSEHLVINAQLVVPQKLTLRLCVTRNVLGSATNAAMAQLSSPGTTASANQQKCFYEFTVHQMRGNIEARLAQIADELFIMGCFSGRPEMSTRLVELPPTNALEKVPVEELEELARKCLLSVVFSFSVGELLYPESARNSVRLSTEIRNLSMINELYPPPKTASNLGNAWNASPQSNKVNGNVNVDHFCNYDAAWDSQRGGMSFSTSRKAPNRIRVRLIGARSLGQGQQVKNPYATVELDDPSQKFVSAKPMQRSQNNNNNPQWDETFEIGINANSKELLFEVYDDLSDGSTLHYVNGYDYENDIELTGGGGRKKFLGLAIVGLDELNRRWEAVEHSGSGNSLVEPFVHQLCLQAHPCSDAKDDVPVTAQQKNSRNIVSGVLLIQCEFLTLSGNSQFPASALKFPVGESPSRGKLTSAATPSYLYNAAADTYGSVTDNIAEIGSTPSLIATGPPPKSPGSPTVVTFQQQQFDNRSPSASLHYSLRDSEIAQQPPKTQHEYFIFDNNDRDIAMEPESERQHRSASRSSANNVTNQSGESGSQLHIHHQQPVHSPSPYDRYGFGASSPGMSASSSRVASQSSVVMNTTFAKQQQPRSAYRTASESVAMAADDGRSSASGGGSGGGGKKQKQSQQQQHWIFSATNAASTLALGSANSGYSAQQLQPPVESDLTVLESTTVTARGSSPPPPPIPPHHQDTVVVADRQREASASPKRRRAAGGGISFFEDLRARLSRGSVSRRRRAEKRAKSLDERRQAPGDLEEANVSMPASRDHSQIRYGRLSQSQVGTEAMSLTESQQTGTGTHLSDGGRQSVLLLELSADESADNGGKIRPEKYRRLNSIGVDDDVPLDEYGADSNQPLIHSRSAHPQTLRYYVIPPHLVDEPACQRLIRAGKKLHVFNNHTFVAVKPRGSVQCNVCRRMIVGSFTKQAYQCRDCRSVTHKSCHVRSTSPCPNSNLSNLQIIDNVDWVDFLKQNQMQEFISMNGV